MKLYKKRMRREHTAAVVIAAALVVGILIGCLLFYLFGSANRNQKQTESQTETESMSEVPTDTSAETETQTAAPTETELPTEVPTEPPTETELPTETAATSAAQEYAVTIENKEEFATQVMANRIYLLDKKVSEYVAEKKIKATAGTILNVAVPEDDISCTEFYVQLNNKKSSMVTLRWDPMTAKVTAQKCQYTKEEVENSVWLGQTAEKTDISPEQDAQILEQQEEPGTETEEGKEVVVVVE